jgi:hypothetical protein
LLPLSAPFFFSVAFCRALQCPVTSLARALFLFFFLLPLYRQQRLSAPFLCAVTSLARRFFACCRSAGQQDLCAPKLFLCGVRSGVHAESFFCMQRLVTSLPAARADFLSFWLCMKTCEWRIFYLVNSRGAHADFFYLFCLVTSSLLSARSFSWTFLLCPRTSRACVSGAPIFFFSVQPLPAAARKFEFVVSGSLTTLVRTS